MKRLILITAGVILFSAATAHSAIYQYRFFGNGSVTQQPASDPVWSASGFSKASLFIVVDLGDLTPTLESAFSVVPEYLEISLNGWRAETYSGIVPIPGVRVNSHRLFPWTDVSNDGVTTSWFETPETANGVNGWSIFSAANANGYWHSIQDPEGLLDSYEFSATWDHSRTRIREITRVPDSVSSFSALACAIFGVLIFSRNGPLRKRHA